MRLFASAVAALALVACDSQGGAGGGSDAPKVAESGTKHGSAGGFSATLSAELAKQNVEPAAIAATAPAPAGGTTVAMKTDGSAKGAAPGAAVVEAGAKTDGAKTDAAKTEGGKPEDTKTDGAKTEGAKTEPGSKAPAGAMADPPGQTAQAPGGTQKQAEPQNLNRTPMKPSADLAAIKFDLEPNWDRDLGEAGTFSLVVKVPNTSEQRVFMVHYGYEDQAAPVDCDSYRKYLEEKKIMTVTLNRQRGGACYVEGDAGKGPQFRYLLTYGGKRLMCNGSLYKDQTSLGDLRDKVLMQAKKICETLAL